jgi:hypothetical protein
VWIISANGGTAQALENTNASDTTNQLAWWPSNNIVYQQPGIRHFLQIDDKTHLEKLLIHNDQSVGGLPDKPVFSPDGERMAVYWNRPDNRGLWIVSLEPYSETLLQAGYIYPVGWSPDGENLYAIRGHTLFEGREIIRVQLVPPNAITSVVTLPGDLSFDDASSSNGQEIIVSIGEVKSDVWLMENFDPSPR